MKTLSRALAYLKPYWHLQIPALLCALGATVCGLAGPWIIKILVDEAFFKRSYPALKFCVVALALSEVLSAVLGAAKQFFFSCLGERAVADLRSDLFAHLQRLSLSFHSQGSSGRVLSTFNNDVGAMEGLYSSTLVELVTNALRILVGLAFLIYLSPQLTLRAWVAAPLFVLSMAALARPLRRLGSEVQERTARITEGLQENLSGAREVIGFDQGTRQTLDFRGRLLNLVPVKVKQATLGAAAGGLTSVTALGGVVFVIWWGGNEVLTGRMSPGAVVAFVNYLESLFGPTAWLMGLNVMLQRALSGAERVFELLDTAPSVADAPGAFELPPIRGTVAFEDVSLSYDGGDATLRGISLSAEPGEMVALVGPSGGGKSSLVSLVPRLYDPTGGRVTVDGIDLRKVTLESLRRQVGVVFQETFLFSTTVRENLRFGRPEATDEEVEEAARAANAHGFIQALPQGYDTPVGERGAKLSGGQRQRLALARTLLRDPRILILDEATSALDSESEAAIQAALETLMVGRTCFVVAHRLSTVQHADRILVLQEGRVVESGSHTELQALGGAYSRLCKAQFGRRGPDDGSLGR
jgi:subfamily B ATP-binding cassette protein MsbA